MKGIIGLHLTIPQRQSIFTINNTDIYTPRINTDWGRTGFCFCSLITSRHKHIYSETRERYREKHREKEIEKKGEKQKIEREREQIERKRENRERRERKNGLARLWSASSSPKIHQVVARYSDDHCWVTLRQNPSGNSTSSLTSRRYSPSSFLVQTHLRTNGTDRCISGVVNANG